MVSQVSRVLVYNLTPPGQVDWADPDEAPRTVHLSAWRIDVIVVKRRSDRSQPTVAAIIVIVLDEPRVCVFVCVHVCVRARAET